MVKVKKILFGLLVAVMAMVMMPANMLPKAHADMSFDKGKSIFQSTWKVNYPSDPSTQWYANITDSDFLGMGSYTIDETALPGRFEYRVTLHLDSDPSVHYWVKISEGIHGYGMRVDKADRSWHYVLDGWRSIK